MWHIVGFILSFRVGLLTYMIQQAITYIIPAKPLHNHDIVWVHFNNFYCTEICNKLSWDLAVLTYIYLNVDECLINIFYAPPKVKLHILLNYAVIPENVISED